MSEKLNNPNQQEQSPNIEKLETTPYLENINLNNNKEIIEKKETNINTPEQEEKIHQEAREKAREKAKENETNKKQELSKEKQDKGYGYISKKQKTISYKKTIKNLQSEMSLGEKLFSQIIHNPLIEKTSEALGRTVARPRPLLLGSSLSFLLISLLYVVAKKFGYQLSGSETIIIFFIGWAIGLTYDYFKKIAETNKK